jgi:hypothetical protein
LRIVRIHLIRSFNGHEAKLYDAVSRREWLRIGSLSAFGLSLPSLLQQREASAAAAAEIASATFGRAEYCIILFRLGGPPQHETWDPKPDAPAEIRGEFGAVAITGDMFSR